MTETEMFLWANVLVITVTLLWGINRILSYRSEERSKQYEKTARQILARGSEQKPLTTPPASETNLPKDHDLESYKDLSAGKCRRLTDEELDEASAYLTSHQKFHIGG